MPSPAERAVFHQRRELAARDIRLKASLGQNILDDPNLCAKIVRAADIVPGETVLEIGPGAGALTRALLDAGARVLAVETDGRLIPLLEERFAGEDHLVVRHADFMKFDLAEARPSTPDGRVKVVSNLPYHLSSPILFRLIDHRALISTATVMLQKEMAARVASGPGTKDYGIVSVRVQAVAEARALFTLPPQVFFPKPGVDSQVIELDFRRPRLPPELDERDLSRCVRAAFSQRRKTLQNALKAAYGSESAAEALAAAEIDPRARAETVPVEGFFRLAAALARAAQVG